MTVSAPARREVVGYGTDDDIDFPARSTCTAMELAVILMISPSMPYFFNRFFFDDPNRSVGRA